MMPVSRGTDACLMLLVLASVSAHAFQAIDLRKLAATERVGTVDLPAGTFLWQSPTNSWRGALLGGDTKIGDRTLPARAVLVFDKGNALRTVWAASTAPAPECTFFTIEGAEIAYPQYPSANVPPEREPILDSVSAEALIVKAAEQVTTRARNSDREVLPPAPDESPGLQQAVTNAGWNLQGAALPAGTFIRIEEGTGPITSGFVTLEDGRLGAMSLPAGTCIQVFFRSGMFPEAGMSSRSPGSLRYQGATIAPGGRVHWAKDLMPQSYLISEPLPFGPIVFPTGTYVSHVVPNSYTIRPPVPLIVGTVPIDGTAFTQFDGTQIQDTWLAKEWDFAPGQRLPAGTHITFRSGRLDTALLGVPHKLFGVTVSGFTIFHPNGSLAHSWLSSPASIAGIDCAGGTVQFHKDARLAGCFLARPHVIAGVKLRAGQFEVTESGALVRGKLDQDYEIGGSTLHPGDVFNGTFRDSAVLTLLDAKGVDDLESTVTTEFEKLIPEALVRLQDGASVMGEYGLNDVKLQSSSRSREKHAFLNHRKYEVVDFVDNPPFNDCDCRVQLTAQFSWEMGKRRQLLAIAGLRPGAPIEVECNFCPTSNLILPFIALLSNFSPVPVPQREVIRKRFQSTIGDKERALVEILTDKEHILPFSFEIDDVFLDNGEMKMKCSFLRTVK